MVDWDQRYATEDFVFGTAPNDFLAEVVDRIPPGPVLCIGDGEGRNGVFLASRGHAVTSVDLSPVGLAKAARLAAAHGVALTTVVADLIDFDPARGGPWAGIVSIFCHLPSAVRAVVYPKLIAALAPGGVLVLESYTPDQIGRGTGGPPNADLMLNAEQVSLAFAGLDIEHLVECERDVIEGNAHSGRAAVVQVLACRPVSLRSGGT